MLGVAIILPTPAFAFDIQPNSKGIATTTKQFLTKTKKFIIIKSNKIHSKFKKEETTSLEKINIPDAPTHTPKNEVPITTETNTFHKLISKILKAFLLALGLFFIFVAILVKIKEKKTQTSQANAILEELAQTAKKETAEKNDEQMKTIIFNFFDMNK